MAILCQKQMQVLRFMSAFNINWKNVIIGLEKLVLSNTFYILKLLKCIFKCWLLLVKLLAYSDKYLYSLHLSSLICCVLTVTIRGSGVDHLIKLPLWNTSCCRLPPCIFCLYFNLTKLCVSSCLYTSLHQLNGALAYKLMEAWIFKLQACFHVGFPFILVLGRASFRACGSKW